MDNWTTKVKVSDPRALACFLVIGIGVMFLSNHLLDSWSGNFQGGPSGGLLVVVSAIVLAMYSAAGVAGWQLWRVRHTKDIRAALITYGVFLVLHVFWSIVDTGTGPYARLPLDAAMIVVSSVLLVYLVRTSLVGLILMVPLLMVQLLTSVFSVYLAICGITL